MFGKLGFIGLGAAAGGIAGVARGDNYSSTATFRNFVSGAAGGAGVAGLGLMSPGILRKLPGALSNLTGIRKGMMQQGIVNSLRSSGIGRIAGAAGSVVSPIARLGGFAARNPGIAMSAGILGGAGIYMASRPLGPLSLNDRPFTLNNKVINPIQRDRIASQQFQNSARGLTFGLHQSRHG